MNNITKSLLITLVSSLLLAGCCAQRHATAIQWEYKVAYAHPTDPNATLRHETYESLLNESAKDGWVFVQKDSNGAFIFRRAKK
jgi:hypothetical protein